jgi:site-specific recombinase XerD
MDVTFHTLRHAFASSAVVSGVDPYTVAQLLGHKAVQMVQRYAHLAPAHLRVAANRTATVIFAKQAPHISADMV